MEIKSYIVNTFTEEIACGNPAGVILLENGSNDIPMQRIALDIGKSETAFIKNETNNIYNIRWFSPIKEMKLCGHASLAAAKVINIIRRTNSLVFKYCDGIFNVEVLSDGNISLEFPLDTYEIIENDNIYKTFFGNMPIIECIRGIQTGKVILIIDEEYNLESINPNYEFMKCNQGVFSQGIGVSKRSKKYDIETRYFNPWVGVNEDPVTGSVHTVLARYWHDKIGLNQIQGFQASYRPGIIGLDIEDDIVKITGKAKIVFEGNYII